LEEGTSVPPESDGYASIVKTLYHLNQIRDDVKTNYAAKRPELPVITTINCALDLRYITALVIKTCDIA
jgi:hypothetical protein